MVAFFIGAGMSGLIPSLLALIQGTGKETQCYETIYYDNSSGVNVSETYSEQLQPTFSVSVFFVCLSVLITCSGVAFLLLNVLDIAKREYASDAEEELIKKSESKNEVAAKNDSVIELTSYNKISDCSISNNVSRTEELTKQNLYSNCNNVAKEQNAPTNNLTTNDVICEAENESDDVLFQKYVRNISSCGFAWLYFMQAWVCSLMMGVLPSVGSYSALAYSRQAYHLSVTLSTVANPVACFIPFWIAARNISSLTYLVLVGSAVSGYILSLAVLSPEPFLVDSAAGDALCIVAWILCIAIFSYVNVCLASLFRTYSHRALFWCGVFTQGGAAVGALIMFPIINVYELLDNAETVCGIIYNFTLASP